MKSIRVKGENKKLIGKIIHSFTDSQEDFRCNEEKY